MVSRKRPDKNRYGEPLRQRGVGMDTAGEDSEGTQGGAEQSLEPTPDHLRSCVPAASSSA